ncbi:MAG TPA: NADPH-dependent FMN reductase [Candidatus Saccharimonadales bacterium]|nr:NADPH-dependent FMN reductase [Candidatus Saccharimonadales bacterium]
MDKLTIAVIAGTVREGRQSIKAAKWVAEFGRKQKNVEIIFVDPQEFAMPSDGNNAETRNSRYAEITANADAFLIVTPEYNHSFPGSLKRLLDSEYDNYFHKPVALAGVSNGPWGGVRACEALLPVCHRLGLVNIRPELYFPKVQELFDNQGMLKPEYTELHTRAAQTAYDELIWMAKALKAARQP